MNGNGPESEPQIIGVIRDKFDRIGERIDKFLLEASPLKVISVGFTLAVAHIGMAAMSKETRYLSIPGIVTGLGTMSLGIYRMFTENNPGNKD